MTATATCLLQDTCTHTHMRTHTRMTAKACLLRAHTHTRMTATATCLLRTHTHTHTHTTATRPRVYFPTRDPEPQLQALLKHEWPESLRRACWAGGLSLLPGQSPNSAAPTQGLRLCLPTSPRAEAAGPGTARGGAATLDASKLSDTAGIETGRLRCHPVSGTYTAPTILNNVKTSTRASHVYRSDISFEIN